MELLKLEGVTVRYGKHTAAENVSFSLCEGDYTAIVGKNGSGKSTILKTVAGILDPSEGQVCYTGIGRGEIGYMPQSLAEQKDFPASVTEIVLSGVRSKSLLPFYTREQKISAFESLRLTGMAEFAKKPFRELSGGQKQRVLLARALCAGRRLLLLDEPVNALDPQVTTELYALLQHLNRDHGVAVLMVTHDTHAALEQAGRILCMDTILRFDGTSEEFQQTKEYEAWISNAAGGEGQ